MRRKIINLAGWDVRLPNPTVRAVRLRSAAFLPFSSFDLRSALYHCPPHFRDYSSSPTGHHIATLKRLKKMIQTWMQWGRTIRWIGKMWQWLPLPKAKQQEYQTSYDRDNPPPVTEKEESWGNEERSQERKCPPVAGD